MAEAKKSGAALLVEGACKLEQDKIADEISRFLSSEIVEELDKRKSSRIPVCFQVTYFVCRENRWDKTERIMQAINLGADGLKAVAYEKVFPRSLLIMRFHLPSHSISQVVGQVKWAGDLWGRWIVGIEFTRQHAVNRKMLENFVSLERTKWFDQVARQTGKDRRMAFRIPAQLSVQFSLYTGMISRKWEKQKERLFLLDLSAGGARFQCGKLLTKGELLSFLLPVEQEALSLIAQIVRVKIGSNGDNVYGARFINLEEKHQEAIASYVAREEQRLSQSKERPSLHDIRSR